MDFTYEHATIDHFQNADLECLSWGAIQAGYNDPQASQNVDRFYETHVVQKRGCPPANRTILQERDLSPTYAHLPDHLRGKIALATVQAGKVELAGQGRLSG